MQVRLKFSRGQWAGVCVVALCIAASGAVWEWAYGTSLRHAKPGSVPSHTAQPAAIPLVPNSFQSLAGQLTGANGRLEPEGRRQLRLADEARIRTRQLVMADRSNVDCAHMKCIALTYDDGPEPKQTRRLLNILQVKQAVATFFVLGSRVQTQSSTLKRMIAERHEIGNHSWSHADLTTLTDQQIRDEIDHTNNAIQNIVGFPPALVRPPMGKYDQRVIDIGHMPFAFWSIDPRDWHVRDPQTIYARVISAAAPGTVIILHDTYSTTVQASTPIIDELQRQGYVLVTMSELFGITDTNWPHFVGQRLRYR